jgi:hypothetical protein
MNTDLNKILQLHSLCIGSFALLDRLPPYPPHTQMTLKQSLMMHLCFGNLPATKPMLPKLMALLKWCQKSNQMYFRVQQSIEYYYYTESNCLFFGDAKKILSGKLDSDKE